MPCWASARTAKAGRAPHPCGSRRRTDQQGRHARHSSASMRAGRRKPASSTYWPGRRERPTAPVRGTAGWEPGRGASPPPDRFAHQCRREGRNWSSSCRRRRKGHLHWSGSHRNCSLWPHLPGGRLHRGGSWPGQHLAILFYAWHHPFGTQLECEMIKAR